MPIKPSQEKILQSYSFDELLDLVKIQAKRETEKRLEDAKKHLSALTDLVTGEAPRVVRRRRRGRRKAAAVAIVKTRRRRARNKKTLRDHLLAVLDKKPKKIKEILDAIQSTGYKSLAKDPKRVLYTELKKQVSQGTVKKNGRGMYSIAS